MENVFRSWLALVLAAVVVLFACAEVSAAISVHPVTIVDPAAQVGRQYQVYVRNALDGDLAVDLSLGWGVAKDGGQLHMDWSPEAAATAAAVVNVGRKEVTVGAQGQTAVTVSLHSLPSEPPGYPVLAVGVRQAGIYGRMAIPILVQARERQPEFQLQDLVWQEGSLRLSVINTGDGFGQFRGQALFDDGIGTGLPTQTALGYIFPGQTRHWILDAPSTAMYLSVETARKSFGRWKRFDGY